MRAHRPACASIDPSHHLCHSGIAALLSDERMELAFVEIAVSAGKQPFPHFCLLVLEYVPLDSKCLRARSLTNHPACAGFMPIGTAPRNSARQKCMGSPAVSARLRVRTGCPIPLTARLLLRPQEPARACFAHLGASFLDVPGSMGPSPKERARDRAICAAAIVERPTG